MLNLLVSAILKLKADSANDLSKNNLEYESEKAGVTQSPSARSWIQNTFFGLLLNNYSQLARHVT